MKKTDGAVTIVGEVASDPVAAYMIQTAQVASLFTLFSHHAKRFPDLIMSLRNSLLKTNVFSNERIAEEQIVRVLNFDIHMEKDITGKRYIERITECIPLDINYRMDIDTLDPDERKKLLEEIQYKYYTQMLGGRTYSYKNIIEFDTENNKYVIKDKISDANIKEMKKAMMPEDRELFSQFLDRVWG